MISGKVSGVYLTDDGKATLAKRVSQSVFKGGQHSGGLHGGQSVRDPDGHISVAHADLITISTVCSGFIKYRSIA